MKGAEVGSFRRIYNPTSFDVEEKLHEIEKNLVPPLRDKGGIIPYANIVGFKIARFVLPPGYSGGPISASHNSGKRAVGYILSSTDWPVCVWHEPNDDFILWNEDTITLRFWSNSWPSRDVRVDVLVITE